MCGHRRRRPPSERRNALARELEQLRVRKTRRANTRRLVQRARRGSGPGSPAGRARDALAQRSPAPRRAASGDEDSAWSARRWTSRWDATRKAKAIIAARESGIGNRAPLDARRVWVSIVPVRTALHSRLPCPLCGFLRLRIAAYSDGAALPTPFPASAPELRHRPGHEHQGRRERPHARGFRRQHRRSWSADDAVFVVDDQFAPLTPEDSRRDQGDHTQPVRVRDEHALALRSHGRQREHGSGWCADLRARERAKRMSTDQFIEAFKLSSRPRRTGRCRSSRSRTRSRST